jgi:hypothetical protein
MKNIFVLSGLFLMMFFTSCEETEKGSLDATQAQTVLTEAVTAYSIYAETQKEATKAAFDAENTLKSGQLYAVEYPQVTIEPFNATDWPKTITIDYGTENLQGQDGRYRRGVMVITASNMADVENTVWDIAYSDFYLNDYKVEGDHSVQYLGKNENNNPEYSGSIVNGKITSPEGKIFFFEQETTREMIAGQETHYVTSGNINDLCDDEYLVTGTHSGESSEGYTYTMSTEEPLHLSVCCKWVMDGKLAVSLPGSLLNFEIDFRPDGDTGEMCNNSAAFSVFGITYPVDLP